MIWRLPFDGSNRGSSLEEVYMPLFAGYYGNGNGGGFGYMAARGNGWSSAGGDHRGNGKGEISLLLDTLISIQ